MLGVNKRRNATGCLSISNRVQGERGFTRRLWTVNFDNAAPGEPSDTESNIKGNRTGGDHGHWGAIFGTQSHD